MDPVPPDFHLTAMLAAVADGRPGAVEELMPVVYERLRGLARRQLEDERFGHTLDPTALVHEAFLKLVGQDASYNDHAHFLAVAAQAMRRILVDHARGRAREKRGGGRRSVTLSGVEAPDSGANELDLIALDDALERLRAIDPEGARVVEMRYFAGMAEEEIARVLDVTDRTVRRYWVHAKAWLSRELLRGGVRDVDAPGGEA